mgnify:CR=1 FL=1
MVRIGMIGAGNIANIHIASYKKNPSVEIAAICDINPERLNETADKFGIEKRYPSVYEMLANEKLDAADVCVWNCAHAECTIAALEAGLDVLCEKPMAMSYAEAKAMEDTAKRCGKLLMLGFVTRFSPEAKITKDLIDQGFFGDIYYSKASYIRRNGNPGGWFSDKSKSGGGAVIDIGVHPLDLTRYLMGNPKPVSVYAVVNDYLRSERAALKTHVGWSPKGADPEHDINDVDTSGIAIIKYDNGATTLLECSYAINGEPRSERSLFGTKGGITLDGMKVFSETNGFMTDVKLVDLNSYKSGGGMFEEEMKHFVDCVMGKCECKSPAEDGVVVMKMLDAIYESARTGHEVVLD